VLRITYPPENRVKSLLQWDMLRHSCVDMCAFACVCVRLGGGY